MSVVATAGASCQWKAFYACWTRKKAFVKALGAGVSYGLEQFEVSVGPEEDYVALTIRSQDEDAAGWLVKNLPVPDSHAAALAVDRPASEFRFWRADTPSPRGQI